MRALHLFQIISLFAVTHPLLRAAELTLPGYTAYALPDPEGARFSEREGVTRWTNPAVTIHWYGHFTRTGAITARLLARPRGGTPSPGLRLTVGGTSRESSLDSAGSDSPRSSDFGTFSLTSTGYHRLSLELLEGGHGRAIDVDSLRLEGPAVEGAHFNLKERRNAASVHLAYPIPRGTNVSAFYCEVTAVEDPTSTFYMACGWHRGYFGMQVNGPTERRIIFSVWDSGGEAVDRDKVSDENRVKLLSKGEGVFTGDFGNEGTGGHSHLVFPWKTGETQRFLVTAQPTHTTLTVFSGYYFRPDQHQWMLISSWRAPKEGGWLQRLHSFSENFWGSNGHLVRKARFGNPWIRTDAGEWIELTTATFSHDPTGKADRLDRFMGVEEGQFFLSHGGFREGFTTFGEKFSRPATRIPPGDLPIPPLP